MSDDLVKRLRLGNTTHVDARIDMHDAADRIEELEERLKAAQDDAKEAEAYAGELEAQLAKAVASAEIVEKCGNGVLWDLARTTLAELTGGKDE